MKVKARTLGIRTAYGGKQMIKRDLTLKLLLAPQLWT